MSIFRIREEDEIVGYMREHDFGRHYSQNGYQWNGATIPYDSTEYFTGYKDRDGRWIFENDVITSSDYPQNEFIITYDRVLTKFLLVDYSNRDIFSVSANDLLADRFKIKRIGVLKQP
ncbi:MAG: hypothetical protein ACQERC_04995 [Bacteroidota bacterium]